MAQYFSLPLPPHVQQINSTLGELHRPRKRKRDSATEEHGGGQRDSEEQNDLREHSEEQTSEDQDGETQDDDGSIHMRTSQMHGSKNQELPSASIKASRVTPPYPFPHAPARSRPRRGTEMDVLRELAELHPPLYPSNARAWGMDLGSDGGKITNLRHHHLGVLTTILHRCLLEGDYERAGRAWALLLRSEAGSKPIELRRDGRWGIGAEILLQRRPPEASFGGAKTHGHHGQSNKENADSPTPTYSEENFQAAREYYDRLILQHPWQRMSQQSSTNASKFYPAMFSLWIFQTCERSRIAMQKLSAEMLEPRDAFEMTGRSSSSADSSSQMLAEPSFQETGRQAEARARIKDMELREAREIADRLDRLLSSPPYDNHGNILELRGMVHLWIGDLLVESMVIDSFDHNNGSVSANEEENYPEDGANELTDSPSNVMKRKKMLEERRAEILKARAMFERAKTHGGHLHLNLSRLSISSNASPR